MKRQNLKQRRSLAAKKGWESRRREIENEAMIADGKYWDRAMAAKKGWQTRRNQAATAPSNQQQITDKNSALNNGSFPSPEEVRAAFFDGLNRANREREAQSKHPGSPDYATKARELAEHHRAFLGRWPDWYVREFPDAASRRESQIIAEHSLPEAKMHNALLKDEMGAKSEARSELLLTEEMRVKASDHARPDWGAVSGITPYLVGLPAKSTLWQRLKSAFQNLARMS